MPISDELQPLSGGEVVRIIEQRSRERSNGRGRPLQIVGGRTAIPFVDPSAGQVDLLSTANLSRVIDYPARDMTVTVEAGMRVQELQELLREEHQRLPIDIPEAHRATLGGAIATNASGPGRFGHGTFRDYVIGIRGVDGQGRAFAAGGRVVKNVAGYDLCKLIVGSRGTLAVLTEVTFKLRPMPAGRVLLWVAIPGWDVLDRVLERLLTSQTRPVVVDVCEPSAARHILTEAKLTLPDESPVLCLGFEGTERETAWQVKAVQSELAPFEPTGTAELTGDEADRLWAALTEYATASDDPLSFDASLRPSQTMEFLARAAELGIAVQAHAGNGIIVGHLPDRCATPEEAERMLAPLAALAAASQGSLRVTKCDAAWRPALQPFFRRPEPADLSQRLRQAFDPHGVFPDAW